MRLIADRGFANLYPENTLRAVEEAVAMADAVAVDVRRCGSGEPVVIGDERVDRVSDGTGAVAERSLAELDALDVLGTGRGVPTLDAVRAALPRGVGLVAVLRERGLAADVLASLAEPGPHAVLTAPPAELEAAPGRGAVPRGYLHESTAPAEAESRTVVEAARSLDCSFLYAPPSFWTPSVVATTHAAGLMAVARPVESRPVATTLRESGVDAVVADRWGVLPARV